MIRLLFDDPSIASNAIIFVTDTATSVAVGTRSKGEHIAGRKSMDIDSKGSRIDARIVLNGVDFWFGPIADGEVAYLLTGEVKAELSRLRRLETAIIALVYHEHGHKAEIARKDILSVIDEHQAEKQINP